MRKNANQVPQKNSSDRSNNHQSYSPNTISLSKLLQKQAELKSKQMNQNITVHRTPMQQQKNFNPSEKKIIVGDMIAYSKESSSNQEQQEKVQKSVLEIMKGINPLTMSTRPGYFNSKPSNLSKNVPRKSPLPIPRSLQTQKYLPMKMSKNIFSSAIPSLIKEGKSTNITSNQMNKTFHYKNTPARSLSPITRKKNTTPKMSPNTNSRSNNVNNSPISMLMERFKKFQMNNMNLMKNKSKGTMKSSNVNNIKSHQNNTKGKSTVFTMDIQQNNIIGKEQLNSNSNSNTNSHSHSNQNSDDNFGKKKGYQSPSQCSQKNIEENHPHTYSSPSLIEATNKDNHKKNHSMINILVDNPSLNFKASSQQKASQMQNNKVIKRIKHIYEFTHVGFDGEEDKANNQDSYFIHRNFAGYQDYIYMSVW